MRDFIPRPTPWPEDKVLAHLQARSGTHFDPQVVDAFLKMV